MLSTRHRHVPARRRAFAFPRVATILAAVFGWAAVATAQTTVYWDINGGTGGASSGTTATGTWDQNSTSNWTTNSGGTATTGTWQARSGGSGIATFAAGTNATGTYTVTVSGTITGIRGITFEEGTVTLSGGTLTLGASSTIGTGANNATISSAIAGSGFAVTKTGSGALTLSGNNTYTGGTTLSAGTLNLNSATAPGTGTLTINGGTINNNSGGAVTLSNNNAVTLGANLTFTGTNDLNLGTGNFSLGAANRTFTINGGNLTVGGVISQSSGSRALTKNGAGTLTLNGNNTYDGLTTVSAGTLTLAGDNSDATGGVTLSGGTLNANNAQALGTGTLTLSGGTLNNTTGSALTLTTNNAITLGGSFAFGGSNDLNLGTGAITNAGNRTFTLSGTNRTLTLGGIMTNTANAVQTTTVNGSGNTLVLGGYALSSNATSRIDVINGSGNVSITGAVTNGGTATASGLTYSGTGSLTLSGNNTYGGLTTVSGGTLTLSGNNSGAAGGVTISGGTLNLNNAQALGTGTFTISGGTINNTSGGALTLSTNNAITLGSTLTFTGTNDLNLGTGNFSLGAANRTFTINGGNLTVGGVISQSSGSRALTKNGAGTLTLNGNNTYDGLTTVSAGTLTLAGDNSGATGGVTLSGGTLNANNAQALGTGTLTLSGGTLNNTTGSALTLTTNNAITLGGSFAFGGSNDLNLGTGAITNAGNRTFTLSGTNRTLTLGGVMTNTANAVQTTTVNGAGNTLVLGGYALSSNATSRIDVINGSGNVSITGAVTNGGTATASGLTYSGTGSLTLSGNNTYDGLTTVSGGTLTLSGNNSGAAGGVTISGGTLNLNNAQALGTGTFTINGGTINNTSGGALTLSTNNAITLGSTLTFAGTNDLNLGTGNFSLGAANRTFTINGGALTIGGVISQSSGTRAIIKNGAGALILGGVNTYTGTTTINQGTLALTGSGTISGANLSIAGTGSGGAIFASRGTFSRAFGTGASQVQLSGTNGAGFAAYGSDLTVSGLTGTWGTTTGFFSASSGPLIFGDSALSDAVVNWTGNFSLGNAARTITVNDNAASSADYARISGVISSSGTSGSLVKNGAGALVLAAANTYQGSTTVNEGVLALTGSGTIPSGNLSLAGTSGSAPAVLATSGTFSRAFGTGANQVQLSGANGAGFAAYGGALTVSGLTGTWGSTTGFFSASSGPLVFGDAVFSDNVVNWTGNFSLGTATRTIRVIDNVNSSSDYAQISGVISSGAGGSLTKDGNGMLVLTANNTYSGGTKLNDGTLAAGHNSAFGTGTLSIGGGTLTASGGARTLANAVTTDGNFRIGGTDDLTLAGSFNLGGGTRTITVDNTGVTTISGVVGEPWYSSLAKAGDGQLVLTNANTFSGFVQIDGGTLAIQNSNALGSTGTWGNIVSSGATLELSNNIAVNEGGFTITGSGDGGVGAIHNLSDSNSIAGQIVLGGDASILASAGSLSFSSYSDLGGNTLTVGGAGDLSFSAQIGGSGGSVVKTGAGTLTFSGSNSYSGTTTINGGTLKISADNNLGNAPASPVANSITLGGGKLETTASFTLNSNRGITLTNSTASNITADTGTTLTYGGSMTGGGSLTFGTASTGAGTVVLSGSSSNTGAIAVDAGIVKLKANNSLGTGSAGTTVASGATLQIDGGWLTTSNGNLVISGTGATGTTGALVGSGGNNRWNGSLTLAGDTTISTSGTGYLALGTTSPSYSRALSDPGGTPVDTHTLALGNNTLTLTGTTSAGDSRAVYVNARITGTGNVVVDMTNPGDIVRYTANMNTYTGTTTINNGTLSLATLYNTYPNDPVHPNFFGINGPIVIGDGTGAANSARLSIQSGSTFDEMINYASTITLYQDGQFNLLSNQSIGGLTFTGGKIDLGSTGGLYLNGDVTVNALAGQTATIAGSGTSTLSLTIHNGNSSLTNRVFNVVGGVGNTSDLTIGAKINNGSLTKSGAGTMTITSDNTTGYEGTTTITDGILAITHGHALGQSDGTDGTATTVTGGSLQLSNNITVGTEKLTLNGTGFDNHGALQNLSDSNTYGGQIVVNDARVQSDAGLLTLSNTVTVNTALEVNGAGNTTISGSVGGASGTLTKEGTGTLILSGSNTYGGSTTINQGVLSLQSNSGLGDANTGTTVAGNGAALELSNAANGNLNVIGEPLYLNGTGVGGNGALRNAAGTNSYGGLVTLQSDSLITANSGSTLTLAAGTHATTQILTVGTTANNGNVNIVGLDNGTGALVKNGSGTLAVSGASTSLGNVTLNAGTLTFGSTTTNTGAVQVNAGTLNFNGTTATTGQVQLSGGAVSVNGSSSVATAEFASAAGTTLTIASGGTVVANYASDTTFSGALAGGGTFEKAGGGTLTFDHSFTATDLTLKISGGTLALADGATIEVGTLHITGNTILDFGSSTATILSSANLIIDAGVTVTVNNWVSLSDAWYATNSFAGAVLDQNGLAPENRITFDGYSNSWSAWVTDQGGVYNNRELRPIPEPSTYGLLFLASSLALFAVRRSRLKKCGGQHKQTEQA